MIYCKQINPTHEQAKIIIDFCAFVLTACKKDLNVASPKMLVTERKIFELKDWYQSHKRPHNLQSRDEFTLEEQTPIWDSTVYFTTDKAYTPPLSKDENAVVSMIKTIYI